MNEQKKIIIVGTSAFAEIAYEYFEHESDYSVVAFSAEAKYLDCESKFKLPVVSFEDLARIYSPHEHSVFVAITYIELNRVRARLAQTAKAQGFNLASFISPRAFVWKNCKIGEHCFIFENNVIQPFTSIGDNVVMWSGNHIGHHSEIGNNCFISSHVIVSGFSSIGDNSFLGINSSISNNVKIAEDCWVGPNALVMKDTASDQLIRPEASKANKVSVKKFFGVSQ